MIDLTNKEIFEEIKNQANSALVQDDVRRSNIFIRNMESFLRAPENKNLVNFPQMQETYRLLLNKLSFVSLASLTEKEIVSLFEENILVGLDNEYLDLEQKATAKLISLSSFEERDILRRKMREALLRNNQKLGEIYLKHDESTVASSIGNWLRKYSAQVGPKPVNPAVSNQFLAADSEVKKLSEKDLILLRKLVNFFEFLKLSSQTPEGLEEPLAIAFEDEIRILNRGNLETIKLPPAAQKVMADMFPELKKKSDSTDNRADTAELEAEIIVAYQGDQKQQKLIAEQQEKLRKTCGTDPAKLQEEFYKSVQSSDANKTVATLKLLTINDQLLNFIKNDPKLNKFLSATWVKLYGQSLADEFVKSPIQPKFVRLFLKYVLNERLKMSETDAGRLALQIGNILTSQGKLEYNRMAYFDVASKQFKWFED